MRFSSRANERRLPQARSARPSQDLPVGDALTWARASTPLGKTAAQARSAEHASWGCCSRVILFFKEDGSRINSRWEPEAVCSFTCARGR
jgi:hypothetical protein